MVEIGRRVSERGWLQLEEALDIPGLDVGLLGIEIDREVEEIRHHYRRIAARQQHVEALEHQDVRQPDQLPLRRHDIADQMRVHRQFQLALARLGRFGEEELADAVPDLPRHEVVEQVGVRAANVVGLEDASEHVSSFLGVIRTTGPV